MSPKNVVYSIEPPINPPTAPSKPIYSQMVLKTSMKVRSVTVTETTIDRISPKIVTVNSKMKARYMQRSPMKRLVKVEAI